MIDLSRFAVPRPYPPVPKVYLWGRWVHYGQKMTGGYDDGYTPMNNFSYLWIYVSHRWVHRWVRSAKKAYPPLSLLIGKNYHFGEAVEIGSEPLRIGIKPVRNYERMAYILT